MAAVTDNPGKWNPGKFPDDWGNGNRDFAHVAPLEYGQETLFQEYEWWTAAAYKPYPWATNFQAVMAMCRKANLPEPYETALSIFRNWFHKDSCGFVYVDSRCRLVRNSRIEWTLYP